jgi:hypothetical protein
MLNLKKVVLTVLTVGSLLCLCSAAASAQLYRPGDAWDKAWRNHPCSEPEISWVLTTVEGHATAGVDCNPANYPGYKTVRTENQMMQLLADYRALMRRQGVTVGGLFRAGNGHTMQTISISGAPVLDVDYGRVVGTAGGSLIGDAGSTLIGHDGASLTQGTGNFYGIKAAGDKVIQFPGRWAKVSQPAAAAPPPARPYTPPTQAPLSDGDVQTCLNSRVNQILNLDNHANHITLFVRGGVATFTGNVVNAQYKNQLMTSALDCRARSFNVNGLRVGR